MVNRRGKGSNPPPRESPLKALTKANETFEK